MSVNVSGSSSTSARTFKVNILFSYGNRDVLFFNLRMCMAVVPCRPLRDCRTAIGMANSRYDSPRAVPCCKDSFLVLGLRMQSLEWGEAEENEHSPSKSDLTCVTMYLTETIGVLFSTALKWVCVLKQLLFRTAA